MAGPFDRFEKLPAWQIVVVWLLTSVLVVVGWYFLFFADSLAEQVQAEGSVEANAKELARLKEEQKSYDERLAQARADEEEQRKHIEALPLSESTVDHLIDTFNQQGRLVGLDLRKWSPGGEERMDFYAKMPVKIVATGTWHQVGEFFRRVTELKQIVNVEQMKLKVTKEVTENGHPILDVEFQAAVFRFLTESERAAGATTAKKATRRTGGAG